MALTRYNLHEQQVNFNWRELGSTLQEFLNKRILEEIDIVDNSGRPIIPDSAMHKINDHKHWEFRDRGTTCKTMFSIMKEPNLITQLTVGHATNDAAEGDERPSIALVSLISAKERHGQPSRGKRCFNPRNTILNITYLFKKTGEVPRVYRQVRVNRVVREEDSLVVPDKFLGEFFLSYLKEFQEEVINPLMVEKQG
jgi:hypothetical protein